MGDLTNQVVTFLSYQTRDDCDDRPFRIPRQIKTAQQVEFALQLSRHVAGGKICGDMRISLRVPGVVIDSICHTDKTITSRPQKPVETVALLRRLNLFRIAPAYG